MRILLRMVALFGILFNMLSCLSGYRVCGSTVTTSSAFAESRDRLDVVTAGLGSIGYKAGCWLSGPPSITSDDGDLEE